MTFARSPRQTLARPVHRARPSEDGLCVGDDGTAPLNPRLAKVDRLAAWRRRTAGQSKVDLAGRSTLSSACPFCALLSPRPCLEVLSGTVLYRPKWTVCLTVLSGQFGSLCGPSSTVLCGPFERRKWTLTGSRAVSIYRSRCNRRASSTAATVEGDSRPTMGPSRSTDTDRTCSACALESPEVRCAVRSRGPGKATPE